MSRACRARRRGRPAAAHHLLDLPGPDPTGPDLGLQALERVFGFRPALGSGARCAGAQVAGREAVCALPVVREAVREALERGPDRGTPWGGSG